jgi:hypothetical protein
MDRMICVCKWPLTLTEGVSGAALLILRKTAMAEKGKIIIANVSMGCLMAERINSRLITRNIKDSILKKSFEIIWFTL